MICYRALDKTLSPYNISPVSYAPHHEGVGDMEAKNLAF